MTETHPGTEATAAGTSSPSRAFNAIGALLVLGIISLAGLLLRMPLNDFRYATALSGTPGTFSATHCHTVPAGRGTSRACTGTFVAADGGFTDRAAHLTDARIKLGKPISLQRESDGSYIRPLAAGAALDLAGAFAIVWGAAFLLVMVCVGWSSKVSVSGGLPLRLNRRPGGTVLTLLGWLYIGSGAAAVLSAAAGIVIAIAGR
ncbi:hypothetical protein [Streptomyces inhibens]|uniref:hypothetical protein n=1 Tax=Streptomyces inhibens TaxID=2293571 RepID=UPI001EE69E44|nr:hypothetical protein [Streptomyces inhibens]UKY47764.1 hypothetical protein KI385_02215 [Streptomyces inhibens]